MKDRSKYPQRSEQRSKQAGLKEKVCCRLDVPPDLLPGSTWVEIRGQNAVTVKGGGKILLYTPEEIRIEVKQGYLSVCGTDLLCTSYYAGAVGIDGCIGSVSFREG